MRNVSLAPIFRFFPSHDRLSLLQEQQRISAFCFVKLNIDEMMMRMPAGIYDGQKDALPMQTNPGDGLGQNTNKRMDPAAALIFSSFIGALLSGSEHKNELILMSKRRRKNLTPFEKRKQVFFCGKSAPEVSKGSTGHSLIKTPRRSLGIDPAERPLTVGFSLSFIFFELNTYRSRQRWELHQRQWPGSRMR